jgi:hypothetical protein
MSRLSQTTVAETHHYGDGSIGVKVSLVGWTPELFLEDRHGPKTPGRPNGDPVGVVFRLELPAGGVSEVLVEMDHATALKLRDLLT